MRAIYTSFMAMLCLSSSSAWAGVDLVRLPQLDCEPGAPGCFERARELLRQSTDSIDPYPAPIASEGLNAESPLGNPRSMTAIPPKKAQGAVVLIHGLWGTSNQFRRTAESLARQGIAVIQVILPGHAGQWEKGKEVRADDWLEETRRAIRLASALGEKVIVGGQSTGGMLAVMSALEPGNRVDGLALLEPAIRVQGHLVLGTCLGRNIVDRLESVRSLARVLVNIDPCLQPMPLFVSMGCEVAQLRDLALQTYLKGSHEDALGNRASDYELSQELGRLVKVPTLLINNPKDNVVSSDDNKKFMAGVNKVIKVGQNEVSEGKDKHGRSVPDAYRRGIGELLLSAYENSLPARDEVSQRYWQEEDYSKLMESASVLDAAWRGAEHELKNASTWPLDQFDSLKAFARGVKRAHEKSGELNKHCEMRLADESDLSAWCKDASRFESERKKNLEWMSSRVLQAFPFLSDLANDEQEAWVSDLKDGKRLKAWVQENASNVETLRFAIKDWIARERENSAELEKATKRMQAALREQLKK